MHVVEEEKLCMSLFNVLYCYTHRPAVSSSPIHFFSLYINSYSTNQPMSYLSRGLARIRKKSPNKIEIRNSEWTIWGLN